MRDVSMNINNNVRGYNFFIVTILYLVKQITYSLISMQQLK